MKLELEQSDVDKLTSGIAQEVFKALSPALQDRGRAADTVFTVETLAAYLQTSPKWVYNHINELPHFRKDGLIRFRGASIERMFEDIPRKGVNNDNG